MGLGVHVYSIFIGRQAGSTLKTGHRRQITGVLSFGDWNSDSEFGVWSAGGQAERQR